MPNPLLAQIETLSARWTGVGKLLNRSTACIGLDVGSFSLKALLVSGSFAVPRLKRMALKNFPPLADQRQKAEIIRSVVNSLNGGREVPIVTGVGGVGTVLRSVSLPEMSEKELKAAFSFEAEKYIPFKLEETFFDSCILGKRPGGRMEVLVAAARKELVNAHLELLSAAGVIPHIVDLESLALGNAWGFCRPGTGGESKVTALLHVGARGTILDFFEGSQLQFTREIPIGGDSFTKAFAENLRLSVAEAEKVKCQQADRAPDVRAALESAWEDWLSQCRVSFDFFENQFGRKVEQLVLSGGSARLIGFKEKVFHSVGLPTDEWNPAAGFLSDVDQQELVSAGSSLAVAVGLAIRGVAG